VNTVTPKRSTRLCVSRSCHGAVSTTTGSPVGCELEDLARHGQRVEEEQTPSLVDRTRRHVLRPPLARPPFRVR
jgi:hypothetical protein